MPIDATIDAYYDPTRTKESHRSRPVTTGRKDEYFAMSDFRNRDRDPTARPDAKTMPSNIFALAQVTGIVAIDTKRNEAWRQSIIRPVNT